MGNNITNPYIVSDGLQSAGVVVKNPTGAYTVGPDDNVVICGGNSLAITLNSTSNSPVYITSVDGTTQRTGCTVLIVTGGATQDWVIADGGASAYCIRIGAPSTNRWAVIGAKTAS